MSNACYNKAAISILDLKRTKTAEKLILFICYSCEIMAWVSVPAMLPQIDALRSPLCGLINTDRVTSVLQTLGFIY
jgi:hypothetical protein